MSKWNKIRHTATKTEVETADSTAVQDILDKAEKKDHALIVIQGDNVGKVYRLKEGKNIIGRHPSCSIPIHQRAVSGFHTELRLSENGVIIEDLQSTNGTVLNKKKITKPMVLKSNDLIKVGGSVLKYVDSELDASYNEGLHDQVTRDSLTGIYNKAYILKSLASSIEIAKTGYPLSLIIFDLDHFKKVNDTYGHLAGDFVLKETCRIIVDSVVRVEDSVGRFGGEEFLIVMPDCALEAATSVAERLRKTIEVHPYDFNGIKIPVTTSVGVVSWVPGYRSSSEMIEAVDILLYKSKQQGRNRVTF